MKNEVKEKRRPLAEEPAGVLLGELLIRHLSGDLVIGPAGETIMEALARDKRLDEKTVRPKNLTHRVDRRR